MYWTKPDFEFPGQDFLGHLEALVEKYLRTHHLRVEKDGTVRSTQGVIPFLLPQVSVLFVRIPRLICTLDNPYRVTGANSLALGLDKDSDLFKALTCPFGELVRFLATPKKVNQDYIADEELVAQWRI
jgi:hypothetical protein